MPSLQHQLWRAPAAAGGAATPSASGSCRNVRPSVAPAPPHRDAFRAAPPAGLLQPLPMSRAQPWAGVCASASKDAAAAAAAAAEPPRLQSIPERIGFIGAGQMGEALLRGFLRSKVSSPGRICASVRDVERQDALERIGVGRRAAGLRAAQLHAAPGHRLLGAACRAQLPRTPSLHAAPVCDPAIVSSLNTDTIPPPPPPPPRSQRVWRRVRGRQPRGGPVCRHHLAVHQAAGHARGAGGAGAARHTPPPGGERGGRGSAPAWLFLEVHRTGRHMKEKRGGRQAAPG